jgi:TRAP-type C4-dicarboxylate transport system permease small subunit
MLRAVAMAPKVFIGDILLAAIAVMLAGVFLRYVMVPITDRLDVDPINFFWVEEVGEMLLAWLTLVGAAVAIGERTHFTVVLFTQHLPIAAQRVLQIVNHLVIAVFGGVIAVEGWNVAALNVGISSPALEISMNWLYGSLLVGGVLIAVFAIGAIFVPETPSLHGTK